MQIKVNNSYKVYNLKWALILGNSLRIRLKT
jgi:hypothetical protein